MELIIIILQGFLFLLILILKSYSLFFDGQWQIICNPNILSSYSNGLFIAVILSFDFYYIIF